MKKIWGSLGMVLLCIVIILFSGEVLMRGISFVKPIYSVEMTKYATRLQICPPEPDVPHAHKPNVTAKLMGVEIALNGLGHRGPDLVNPKPENEKRLFVLGSSITLGWGVPYKHIFTTVVEDRLNRDDKGKGTHYRVINAGIANYNTPYELALYKRQGPDVRPDFVLLNYFINDAEIIPMGKDSLILRHSLFIAFIYQKLKSFSSNIKGRSLSKYYTELHEDGQPGWEQTKLAMKELSDLCQENGIPLLVMLTPNTHNLSKDELYPKLYEKILVKFEEMGVPVINTYPQFISQFGDDQSKVWVAPDDPHPNTKGHKIMADAFYGYLKANPL
jgi:lysophospholipase L1-like esterase|tara:strand:+ start:226 stop:1218 length:993 start_codon:yes stop_codon:yes gene_type:complete